MSTILDVIAQIVGELPNILNPLKLLLEALGKLFAGMAPDKVAAITQDAQELAEDAEEHFDATQRWFNDMFPTKEALLKEWPKLPALMYAAYNITKDQHCDLHTALTAVQLQANVIKMSQG